jgi:hypothetical protein
MKQPWIHKAVTDMSLILLPPFIVLAIVVLFPVALSGIEHRYPFYIWLFLIVMIDVGHVYATIFKTYLVPEAFARHRKLLLLLPVVTLCIGFLLFLFGSRVFWSVLAYIAVFHFIRQQYGFMRLYSRTEAKARISSIIDSVAIYSATLYPMLYWFFGPGRTFNWFMPGEFFYYQNPFLLKVAGAIYVLVLLAYISNTIYTYRESRFFNVPKTMVLAGTAASWYFGIVYYNNDLIFTMLNVVSHGVPYMALVYFKELRQGGQKLIAPLRLLGGPVLIAVYLLIIAGLAFSEEYLWEIMVWNEQFSATSIDFSGLHILLVPLLAMPQLTHYLLDGFIWKSNYKAGKV